MNKDKKYIFRKSIEADKLQIKKLFEECFGEMAEQFGALNWVENRYMLALFENDIVACTGILPLDKSDYNGYEVTWTCTTEKHRHNGLITTMLNYCETELTEQMPIYCDCWHLDNKQYANLHNALIQSGYHKAIESRVKRAYPHSKECNGCLYKKKNCICSGDLYIKEKK